MKSKLKVQCPCGYLFENLNDERDAIVRVRSHFELFHKDFLPFGITDAEVLAMLRIERGNLKVTPRNAFRLKQNSPMAQ